MAWVTKREKEEITKRVTKETLHLHIDGALKTIKYSYSVALTDLHIFISLMVEMLQVKRMQCKSV